MYTLNETGQAIWDRLNGPCTLAQIVESLATEYSAAPGEIESDVRGLVSELLRRRMLVEATAA